MARIQVEAKVHLPPDAAGVSVQPGQVIEVETDNPFIRGYIETGLLAPVDPLEFPGELRPPVAPAEDGAADVAAGEEDGVTVGPIPDAPQHAAQTADTSSPLPGLLAPYDGNTVEALRAELDHRGVDAPSDARKADLIAALEANDAGSPAA